MKCWHIIVLGLVTCVMMGRADHHGDHIKAEPGAFLVAASYLSFILPLVPAAFWIWSYQGTKNKKANKVRKIKDEQSDRDRCVLLIKDTRNPRYAHKKDMHIRRKTMAREAEDYGIRFSKGTHKFLFDLFGPERATLLLLGVNLEDMENEL
ncbi:unnamed protein product [Meganyctiphanes norvegica]|uniref:Uncharacterized protein n=1 Tax=Meganyctiphanes norvegica TaxID=48144 RepID=A0AAV2QFE5_MEGNR